MKKRIWLSLFVSGIVVPGLINRAVAQISVPESLIAHRTTGPVLAAPGEHLLMCMSGKHTAIPINVTLQFLNAVTGAVVSQEQITLQPTGSTALPTDPCLEMVIPAANTSVAVLTEATPASRPLFIGVVSLNPQPLPPGACVDLAASLQVFTPGSTGAPTNIRYIPLLPPDPCFLCLAR